MKLTQIVAKRQECLEKTVPGLVILASAVLIDCFSSNI